LNNAKGTILVGWAKTIRAHKGSAYDDRITPGDQELLAKRILSSSWYPYDTYKRCFLAVTAVEAGNDMDLIRTWGKQYGNEIVQAVYKKLVATTSPMQTLKRYTTIWEMFYDFGECIVEPTSDRSAVVTIRGFDRDFEALYHLIMGWLEGSLELTGARDIQIRLLKRSWMAGDRTSYDIRWQ